MRSHLGLLFLLSLTVYMASCSPVVIWEEATTAIDVAAINSLRDEFIALHNASDAAGLTGLYTNDAVLMPPNQEPVIGDQAIESWFQTTFDQFSIEFTLASDELEVVGDLAFDGGTYMIALTPKADGEPMEERGKYIVILRKQVDGSWKLVRDIWNSNNPLPGAGG